MNDTKSIAVVVLSVMFVILFIAFIATAVGLQKSKNLSQSEIANRLNSEEQLQKVAIENTVLKNELAKLNQTLLDTQNTVKEVTKLLNQEQITTQALKNELEREKILNGKLQEDLKDELVK